MKFIIDVFRFLNVIPVPLLDIQPRLCLARAIIEATHLGIFTAIADSSNGATMETIKASTGLNPFALETLIWALSHNGYLYERKGRFYNSRWVRKWILNNQTGMPTFVKFQASLWHRLSLLEHVLRTGEPKENYHDEAGGLPSEKQEVYTVAMREAARMLIGPLLRTVRIPENAERMLDVGGAHGDYARAMAAKFSGLRVTVLDLPGPSQTGSAFSNPTDRVEFRSGDIFHTELHPEWDVILLVNMVHLFSPDRVRDLISRCSSGLKPGGTLIVMDQFIGLKRFIDPVASLVSLSYLSAGGKVYHKKELIDMFRDAGLKQVTSRPFLLRAPNAVFQAWK